VAGGDPIDISRIIVDALEDEPLACRNYPVVSRLYSQQAFERRFELLSQLISKSQLPV
jgi:hypothetical protein